MTERHQKPLLFSSLLRKKIVADFNGDDITTDGGLPLIREVDRRIGLIDAIDSAIDDPRCPWLIEHDQRTILAQRIFAINAGYEDLNDHQTLRNDTLMQAITDRRLKVGQTEHDPLSNPPTLCRLAGTELATAQATTIRLKLLKIGGRIVRSVRRIAIHLAGGYPLQALFHTVLHNLQERRFTAGGRDLGLPEPST